MNHNRIAMLILHLIAQQFIVNNIMHVLNVVNEKPINYD